MKEVEIIQKRKGPMQLSIGLFCDSGNVKKGLKDGDGVKKRGKRRRGFGKLAEYSDRTQIFF